MSLRRWRERQQDLARRRAEAAVFWAKHPAQAPSGDPVVVFLIPLISRARARDWALVTRLLQGTLRSLRTQSDPRWHALVCGQDQPDGIENDTHLTFLPYSTPDEDTDSATHFDKWHKRRALIDHLVKRFAGRDGYSFSLDADDLLHPDLVLHIVSDNNGGGYYGETGYMMDYQSGNLAWCGPRSLRRPFAKPFLRHCGSSAAIRFDFRSTTEGDWMLRRPGHHRLLPETMAVQGLTVTPFPFPAGIYVVNHGDNIRNRRGKMDEKLTYLRQNALDQKETAAVRDIFSLHPT